MLGFSIQLWMLLCCSHRYSLLRAHQQLPALSRALQHVEVLWLRPGHRSQHQLYQHEGCGSFCFLISDIQEKTLGEVDINTILPFSTRYTREFESRNLIRKQYFLSLAVFITRRQCTILNLNNLFLLVQDCGLWKPASGPGDFGRGDRDGKQ
jgi:hypothetical protein